MSTDARNTFTATYDWARDWRDLPWAHEEPTLFLADLCARRAPGRALDIGCGAGTDSVYLARQGWEVTALDFIPKALEYTRQRAAEAGVSVTPVEADITRWQVPGTWDLVLDHGLLHNLPQDIHAAYRERVLAALAPGGDFILLHWHPRRPGQPDGRMGPRRVSREAVNRFFAPELQECLFAREEFEDLPDMVGGEMAQAYYWFRHNPVWLDPAGLLDQVELTQRAQAVSAAGVAPGSVDPALLARVIGPGRLGLASEPPDPAEVEAALVSWASAAGRPAADVLALLRRFADAAAGGPCTANPRCSDCQVSYCKRQRSR
jgi:SAM-dependent methyltransferase